MRIAKRKGIFYSPFFGKPHAESGGAEKEQNINGKVFTPPARVKAKTAAQGSKAHKYL